MESPENSKSHYDILGVRNDATLDELTKSFRRLALVYHPDKSPTSEEKFKTIARAYKVLSDPETRQIYDSTGEDQLSSLNVNGEDEEGFTWKDLEHLIRQFGVAKKRSTDVKELVEVTLEDIYVGVTKKVTTRKFVLCDLCKDLIPTCESCHGFGETGSNDLCESCHGRGFVDTSPSECLMCQGTKRVPIMATYSIEIKPGTYNGQHIPFLGEGDEEPGALAGDRVFVVKTLDHPLYQRVNFLDLATDVVITSAQKHAKGGHDVKLPTLDGSEMNIHLPEGIANGRTLEVDNAGLPDYFVPSKRGKLLVKIRKIKSGGAKDSPRTPAKDQQPQQSELGIKRSGSFKRFEFMRNSFKMTKNKKENRKSMPEFRMNKDVEPKRGSLDAASMNVHTPGADEMVDIDFTDNVVQPQTCSLPEDPVIAAAEKRWPYYPNMGSPAPNRSPAKPVQRKRSFFRLSFRSKKAQYVVTSTPTKDQEENKEAHYAKTGTPVAVINSDQEPAEVDIIKETDKVLHEKPSGRTAPPTHPPPVDQKQHIGRPEDHVEPKKAKRKGFLTNFFFK